ncbi:prepilin peptidase [Gilliamella sp. wkB112]|uniref:prepilin peptidase n=1 Tax=Gilliamella sp. wkB112 TaxID=3120257 RepID=UPI00080E0264|nr:A24 family peptidase [Gilliamella apicola]OCG03081.1 hypothetical protein A9G12_09200 [Gilliamella apicola]
MIIVIASLGFCLGSFINVAYYRFSPSQTFLQYMLAITIECSSCPHCRTKLAPWQLIPVISWLILNWHCYYCHARIAYQYFILELSMGILFTLIFVDKGINNQSIILMTFAGYFILLALIDFNYYLLPDFFTQPLMWLGLICAYFEVSGITIKSALTSILLGYLLLKIPASLFYLITKKNGLGMGDIKLLAAFGAWLPYERLPLLLVFASLIGIFNYWYLNYVLKRQSLTIIPFGPCLLISGYVIYYFTY